MIIDEWLQDENVEYVNNDIQILLNAWINEKTSPELLQFQDVVLVLLELCETQVLKIQNMATERSILELEIARIQYLIKSYLRVRLQKIEKYAFYYENNESFKLSAQEQEYLKEYSRILKEYLLESGLETFPNALHGFDDYVGDLNMISSPNLNSSVVCKVLDNIGEVLVHEK